MRELALPDGFAHHVAVVTDVTIDDFSRLTGDDRRTAATFASEKRRHEWAGARIAARLLAERRGLLRPGDELRASGTFPPRAGDLWLSFSHSAHHGAASVSLERTGVDLERVRPVQPRLARFFLHHHEFDIGDDLADRLIHLWAAKEAAFKLAGDASLLKNVRFTSCSRVSGGLELGFECGSHAGVVLTTNLPKSFVLALASARA